jgi:uncharacterized membrane protein YgcG
MHAGQHALRAWLPSHHSALGGGGLAHLIVRLFIWHEIFRLFRYLWRIPTFGPYIVIVLGLVLAGLIIWRQSRGSGWRRGRGGGRTGSGGGTMGNGGGSSSPRDW